MPEDAGDDFADHRVGLPSPPRAIWDRDDVQYPGMRLNVISALQSLADREYQERVWVRYELPHPGYYDAFDLVVHILYDDMTVLPDPQRSVGVTLLRKEVAPLAALEAALGPMIDDLGDVRDADYLADPRWPAVVRAAGVALRAFGMSAHG